MRATLLAAAIVLVTSGCTQSPAVERHAAGPTRQATVPGTATPSAPSHKTHGRLSVSVLPGRLPRPLAREALAPGADRSHVVVAGGLLNGDISSRATYRLDLRSGRSRGLPDLATAVHDTAGSVVAGHLLVIGGGNATEQSAVQERGRAGWHVVGHLPAPRSDLTAVSYHGTTFVLGGYDGRTPALADVLASADGRRWRTVARLPVPVRYAAVARFGRTLWVFGGEVDGSMVRVMQRIDLTTGGVRVVGRLPGPLGHSVAVLLGSRVLLIGGRTDSGAPTSRMWWFRPRSGRFSAAGHLPTPLADTAVVEAGSTAYLVGGERPALSDRVLRLDWVVR
ncbi:MAG: hypothetical protein QOF53_1656 [Nocardioidaceae bacterium]|nr:hypothetical protein [Nocardioidaceae bacterium]